MKNKHYLLILLPIFLLLIGCEGDSPRGLVKPFVPPSPGDIEVGNFQIHSEFSTYRTNMLGIDVASDGKIYAARSTQNFIQVWSKPGVSLGTQPTIFDDPNAPSSNSRFVSDRITTIPYQIYITEGSSVDGFFRNPKDVIYTTDIYVADTRNNRIQKFNSNFNFVRKWEDTKTRGVTSLAARADTIFFTNKVGGNADNVRFLTPSGSIGTGFTVGAISGQDALATDNNSGVYVSVRDAIQKWVRTSDIMWTMVWESTGFFFPSSLEFDDQNRLWVYDGGNNKIVLINPSNGVPILNDTINFVAGGFAFHNGFMYIADISNKRVVLATMD